MNTMTSMGSTKVSCGHKRRRFLLGCWFGVVGEGGAIQLLNSTVYYRYGLFGFAHFSPGDTTPYPFATGAPKVVVLNLVLFSVAIIGLTRLLAKTVRLTIFPDGI